MADRYPLVYNPSANQLQELQSGDSLDLGNAGLKNVTTITAVGFKTSTGTSAQFLKADGSVDSNTYLTSSGTVALAQGLTGSPSITVSNVTGANGTFSGNISAVNGTFSGDVSIAGTITYDDVTHVDSQGIGTFRQGIEVVGHSELDALRVSGIATFQNNVHLPDNVKINIGTGNDLEIYHDSSHSRIVDSGTGHLIIQTSELDLMNAAGNEDILKATQDGGVELYHNNVKKFETTSDGATLTGRLIPAATDTYGLGTNSARWANLFMSGDIDLSDNDKLRLGASDDLQIYHDGSNSYIAEGGTGVLKISSNRTEILSGSGETCAHFQGDGAVDLYYDNSKKFETTSSGITVSGSVSVPSDSNKFFAGASSEMQVFHDGTNSIVKDTRNSGKVRIQADNFDVIDKDASETMLSATVDGAVSLNYNGSTKLATTSSGVTITGTATATSYVGDGSSLTGVGGENDITSCLFT